MILTPLFYRREQVPDYLVAGFLHRINDGPETGWRISLRSERDRVSYWIEDGVYYDIAVDLMPDPLYIRTPLKWPVPERHRIIVEWFIQCSYQIYQEQYPK